MRLFNTGTLILVIAAVAVLVSLPCPVTAIGATAFPPASTTQENHRQVNDSLADFYSNYPGAKNITDFASFINEHGFGGWYAEKAYMGYVQVYPNNSFMEPVAYDYVYLLPGKNYTKKFVALYQTQSIVINDSSGNRSPPGRVWMKEVNISEELQPASSEEDLLSSFSEWPKEMHWMGYQGVIFGTYPEARNNATISGFIEAYGISGFSHEIAYGNYRNYGRHKYEYVYIIPEKDYPYKLAFLYNFSSRNYNVSEQIGNNSILWVKLVGRDENLPSLSDREARSYGIIGNVAQDNTGASPTPGFMPVASLAAIAISLLIIRIKRKYE